MEVDRGGEGDEWEEPLDLLFLNDTNSTYLVNSTGNDSAPTGEKEEEGVNAK